MSTEARREADARRRRLKPWRKWYSTKKWTMRRAAQKKKTPWCEPCKREGRSRPMTVANHKIPHRGDPWLFWHGELESVCTTCHNSMIQRAEAVGFRPDHDADGWPTDPAHPFNRMETRAYDAARSPGSPEGYAQGTEAESRRNEAEAGHRDPSQ